MERGRGRLGGVGSGRGEEEGMGGGRGGGEEEERRRRGEGERGGLVEKGSKITVHLLNLARLRGDYTRNHRNLNTYL